MEHFKIINLLETMKLLNHINLGQKFGLKQMMFMERITAIVKSNLKSSICDYSDAYILVKKENSYGRKTRCSCKKLQDKQMK